MKGGILGVFVVHAENKVEHGVASGMNLELTTAEEVVASSNIMVAGPQYIWRINFNYGHARPRRDRPWRFRRRLWVAAYGVQRQRCNPCVFALSAQVTQSGIVYHNASTAPVDYI